MSSRRGTLNYEATVGNTHGKPPKWEGGEHGCLLYIQVVTIFFSREGTDHQVCWSKPIQWKDTPLARYPQSWLSWVLPLHQGWGESPLVPQQGCLTPSFLFSLFYRHIVDLQCCYRCAAKWFIYVCIYNIYLLYIYISLSRSKYIYLPGGASGKEPAFQCGRHKRHGFNPWVKKIPWRKEWQPTPVFLPGESIDRGTWQAAVHGFTQSQTWLKQLSINIYIYIYTPPHTHIYILFSDSFPLKYH